MKITQLGRPTSSALPLVTLGARRERLQPPSARDPQRSRRRLSWMQSERDPGFMEIEILVVTDCPHAERAAELLDQALDDFGREGARVTTRVITDQAEADRCGFTGSPTFLIDGCDPFADTGRARGLACRVYRTPDGLSGLPSVDQLRQALTSTLG